MSKKLLLILTLILFSLVMPNRIGADVASTPLPPLNANIRINTREAAQNVDARNFGTNIGVWLGNNANNATLQARLSASGARFIRIPGGSLSDEYGWLSCEMRASQPGAYPCSSDYATWATNPTGFIKFLKTIEATPVIYTMNVNVTPQEAAAAVAFFNAKVGDTTVIGVDRKGSDWQTAGYWAQLRAEHGNPDPFYIQYWEIGNEVFASQRGTNCPVWGYENGWTCDGTEYVNGILGHAGFRAMRDAMRAVDPTILVGAVGTEDPADFSDWGNKVIRAAGDVMDFYIIHPYAYFETVPNNATGYAKILAQPTTHWHEVKAKLQSAFNQYAHGREIPIAATEYNLFGDQNQDTEQLMTRAVNALFIADSIGQAMQNGFAMTNQWDVTGQCGAAGTCFTLLQDPNFRRAPQYFAFPLWARFGNQMLNVASSFNPASQLSVYAGRVDVDTYTVLAINKTNGAISATIALDDSRIVDNGIADVAQADSLSAKDMTFNNVLNLRDDLSNAPSVPLASRGNPITYTFAPYSITLLKMHLSAPGTPMPTPTATPSCFFCTFLPFIFK